MQTLQEIIDAAGRVAFAAEHPEVRKAAQAIHHFARAAKMRACGTRQDRERPPESEEGNYERATKLFNEIIRPSNGNLPSGQDSADTPPLSIQRFPTLSASSWLCSKDRCAKILTLWNKAISLGADETELRDRVRKLGAASRQELTDEKADQLIAQLTAHIDTRNCKEATA